jgi:hypothetical protein
VKYWGLPLLAVASLASAKPGSVEHPAMTAYVARVVSARELPVAPCPDENECSPFSSGYELQLEVVQPILGAAKRGPRKATINLHGGFPEFGHHEHAFVFEFAMPQGGVLSGEGYPVAKTRNGPWAFCADGDHWVPFQGRPVKFVAPIRLNEATHKIENAFLPESGMPPGKRVCHHGIWAEELATQFEKKARPALPSFIIYELRQQ